MGFFCLRDRKKWSNESRKMDRKKVVVGMSGGVDSTVTAWLLKEAGYDVTGVTILTTSPDKGEELKKSPSIIAASEAKKMAENLGISHRVVDERKAFQSDVIEPFMDEYLAGRTPNPCVLCNPKVKWAALLSVAKDIGADYVATGHYAGIIKLDNGRFAIRRASSTKKDQSYALYGLSQDQLAHTLLPLGDYEKPRIREIAEGLGLPVAEKPDSQDICFIPDHDYAGYIMAHCKKNVPEGNFVNEKGEVLGRHKGIIHYTIGQRKGLKIAAGHPIYVTAIKKESNEVLIGEREDLFTNLLTCDHLHFMAIEDLKEEMSVTAKIRYNHAGTSARIKKIGEDLCEVKFAEPVRAVTPGQAVVFYDGEVVVGGGTICGQGGPNPANCT